ncbi:MAG TPA: aminoacyl--tRNA ligase-related protein [Candidatus Saccharimonadales bacterium]|nr:aminoacyl--tRNA ligase-related protein [Candidatus Saccharimonadales bacterium]
MKYSQLFTKTSKTVPSDETARNAQLLIQAGFVHKEMAGVYAYLPLGLKVLEHIKNIVREEMNAVNGQELIMTNLQRPDVWQTTTRWDDEIVDIWFKTKLKDDTEIGLAWSHEEPILNMMQQFVQSYKDLPVSVYQFQTKLRNELRAKSGIMRGREFLMKDMYSLHASAEDLDNYYNQVKDAYTRVFERVGIGSDTFLTFASGGAFTKFSHEFQTICAAGEDILYIHRGKNIAVNEEVLDDAVQELGVDKSELEKVVSAEVGNIFNFGTDKSAQMGIYFTNAEGHQSPLYLGSYGIGITRIMGVIAEKYSDDKGLVWPESIAPARVYLARLGDTDEIVQAADQLYAELTAANIGVLYDDRDVRPGEKFADADLLGIPMRVVISEKTISSNNYECKRRRESEVSFLNHQQLIETLSVMS